MKKKILLVALIVVTIGLFTSVNNLKKKNDLKQVEVHSIKKEIVANATIIPSFVIPPPPPPPPPKA